MNRHDEIRLLLHDFVDHELPADREDDVALHLAECESCSTEVDGLLALRAAAQDLPTSVAPDDDLWSGIAGRIGDAAPTASSPRPWTPRFVGAVAAVLAVALLWPRGAETERPLGDLSLTYDTVRLDGERALSDEHAPLDAAGRSAVAEGMTAIDDAIRETQAALEAVADAPEQFRHLADGYQKKLDLLQRLVRRAARP